MRAAHARPFSALSLERPCPGTAPPPGRALRPRLTCSEQDSRAGASSGSSHTTSGLWIFCMFPNSRALKSTPGGTARQRGGAQSQHSPPPRPPPAPGEALTLRQELGVGLQAVVVPAEATRVVPELTVQFQLLGEKEAGEGLGAGWTPGRGSQMSLPWPGQPQQLLQVASTGGLESGRGVLAPGVTEDQEGLGTGGGPASSPGPEGPLPGRAARPHLPLQSAAPWPNPSGQGSDYWPPRSPRIPEAWWRHPGPRPMVGAARTMSESSRFHMRVSPARE